MDSISIIVTALFSGITITINPLAEQTIKDAYAGLKELMQHKYGQVDLPVLEVDPTSKARQGVVQEDLENAGAGQDKELLAKAQALLDAIQIHVPDVPQAVGLDLEDIKAASLTAQHILAEGPHATGVKIKGAEIQGDITFTDVTIQSGEKTLLKKSQEGVDQSHSPVAVAFQEVSAGRNILIGNTIYTRSDLEELKEYLARAVSAYEANSYQRLFKTPSAGSSPYKFLDAFAIEDASIFFGRNAAIEELYNKVVMNRFTVLHAKSGAGKTSLLHAGLSPRFIREGRLPLHIHAYEDPILTIKRLIASAHLGPWPKLLHEISFYEFIGLVCGFLSRQIQELVIIFDQFEQFFLLWPELETRSSFIRALGACYDDQVLPLRFIIALRKDYYSDLDEFNQILPHLNVFQNQYRLKDMTVEEAQMAITKPLARLDISVTYESSLLQTLLIDLTVTRMELPLLQIICTRLYETRDISEEQITLKTYEALGRAEGVLSSYLNNILSELPGDGEELARNMLKEFVRSDGMKQAVNYKVLAAREEVAKDKLDNVLDRLVNARLLRRNEIAGEIFYELSHEYLTREIVKWINSADQEFKRAEELLERELLNWRIQHMLIPKSRLEILYPYRERFQGLDAQAWECLVSSALSEDFAVIEWARMANNGGELALFQALKAPDVKIRLRSAETLRVLRNPHATEPLIAALKDEDKEVRKEVAQALEAIGDPQAAESLVAALKDEDREVREQAAKTLKVLGASPAVGPLIAALEDADEYTHLKIVEILWVTRDPAVKSLIAALHDEHREIRRGAAQALGAIGDTRAVKSLIAALHDEHREVREEVVQALEAMRDPRAVEPLIGVLNDEDAEVRGLAIWALGMIGDIRAFEPLIDSLMVGVSSIRESAAWALGAMGDTRAVEPLIGLLKFEDVGVREQAIWALGAIGDTRAVESLIDALKDENQDVQKLAVHALGKIADTRAIEPLTAALKNEDAEVQKQAALALRSIGDKLSIETLSAIDDTRLQKPEIQSIDAVEGSDDGESFTADMKIDSIFTLKLVVFFLRSSSDLVIGPLIGVLQNEDAELRRQAAWELGVVRDTRVVEPLIATLHDEDSSVRRQVAWALGAIRDNRALEPLTSALHDEDSSVRRQVAWALGAIRDNRALEPLTSALHDEDEEVQEQANQALESLRLKI